MRVLVTGSSGFIGSSLIHMLSGRGHEVRAGTRSGIPIDEALTGCHAVVHLANLAHATTDRLLLREVNVEGTRRVAESAASRGVRRFVYVSSIKAIGEETEDRPLDGRELPRPTDEYGRAKLAAERAIAEVSARSGIEVVVLRPPLVYGPRVKANFLALMRAIAHGWPLPFASIANRRSLIYVENLCAAIAACLELRQATGKAYVVSDGQVVSTPELCRELGAALGRPARLVSFPVRLLELFPGARRLTRSLEVDDSVIRRELDWQPAFSFRDGLRATVRWYQRR